MSRRNNGENRCERCRMHATLCVCELIPTLSTRTRLVLVIHRREARKPTNTGRLAILAMPNSEVLIRGHEDDRKDAFVAPEGSRPLLLFPHEGAIPLDQVASSPGDDRPVTLVVPDGNWRQASKIRQRVGGVSDIPCVTLPAGRPSSYRLRYEAHREGLATVEAIARALRILEGDRGPHVEDALISVFQAVVERTLWTRGVIENSGVTGGIPEGAQRHDPGQLGATRGQLPKRP